jgi:phenylacetate-CoA ligase
MTSSRPRLGDWASVEELYDLQIAQLPYVLDQARVSPFYRERFAAAGKQNSAPDFQSLELTTKQDLRDQYPFGLLAVQRQRLATYHESSGTAGQPTPSYYTDDDWADLAERYARKWIGISASDMFLVRTPYALMITGHLAHAAARLRGATVVPGDSRSAAMPHARVVRVLHDLGITLTWSNPTESLLWAASARALGYRPERDFPQLRALFVGGESLTPARRQRISAIWGVPVIEEYGSTETGTLAGQCPDGRLHLWADRVFFEVYSPATGELRLDGRGQLVVTPLYREAMPLLRYNLADDVEVSYEPCSCGWLLPTVRVFGRSASEYRVGSGKVTQYKLEELVFGLPVECGVMFWRAKAEPQILRLQFEVRDLHRDHAVKELGVAVKRSLGVPCEITALSPGTLVPHEVLTGDQDVLKPRGLFGPNEDWKWAILYH